MRNLRSIINYYIKGMRVKKKKQGHGATRMFEPVEGVCGGRGAPTVCLPYKQLSVLSPKNYVFH